MQYLEQYKQMLQVMNQVEGVNLDLKHDGKCFADQRVEFGYVIYHLEKARIEKMHEKIADEFDKQFEEMYQLGREAGAQDALKKALGFNDG